MSDMGGVAGVLAGGLATVLAALMVFVQPIRGKRRFERLKQAVATDPTAKLRHYRSGVASLWALSAVVAVIAGLAAAAGHELSLPPGTAPEAAWLLTVELVVLIPLSLLLYRRPKMQGLLRRQIGDLRPLLPATTEERRWFVAVSVSAGICEELIMRGFGFAYVRWLLPDASNTVVVVVVSAVFGFAHLYQGPKGVVLTGVLGALFGVLTIQAGSLLPAMIVHAAVDLRIVGLPAIEDPAPEPLQPPPSPVA